MAEKKYVDYDGLKYYDGKIKAWVEVKDADVLAAAKKYADDLAVNYDAAGAAATAESNAKGYTDGKVTELNGTIAGVKTIAEQGVADAATAQGAAEAAQDAADNLAAYVGTFTAEGVDTVVKYIDKKTEGIASDEALTQLAGRVTDAEGAIDAIEADYLKAADKTELAGLITAEETRAKGIEGGLETRLAAVEADYLVEADKTELVGAIATAKSEAIEAILDGVTDNFDTLKEVAAWIQSDTTRAAELTTRVSTAEGKITTLEGEMDAVEGRMDTAEGEIDDLQAAMLLKAEKSELEAAVEALEGADSALDGRIAAIEGKFEGDQSVAQQIATAKQEAIDAAATAAAAKDEVVLAAAKKYADDEDALIEARVSTLETASATHALAADLTALDGRVVIVEGKVATLESEMDAVEAKAAANETAIGQNAAAIALKADQTALDAATGRITANEGSLSAHGDRLTALENKVGDGFVAITNGEIDALFA